MLKWITILLVSITCYSAFADDIKYESLTPPVEIRGIWVDAGSIPKTGSEVRQLVRTYHKANINVLFPEVIGRGYTIYPSKLLAQDSRFVGAPDVLAIMISEAHKLGMEVHPWVWVFRAGYTKDKGAILTAHPDWIELNKYGEDLSANGGLWISPAIPAARDFLANLYAELVSTYNVDGLHLDYIRYEVESPTPYGYSETSRCMFKQEYGIDPLDVDRLSRNQYSWNRFRERLISTFVQRISEQTKKIKPTAKISAAVGSEPQSARLTLLQNWVNWADNKWIDFLTPMAYTNKTETFNRLVTAQKCAVGNKTIIAPGIGLHVQKNAADQTVEQIGTTRMLEVGGQTLFASAYYGDLQESALTQGPYACPANLPFRNPVERSKELCNYADSIKDTPQAPYYVTQAANLAEYANYQATKIPYVQPTQPPLNLPAIVIPLPSVEITRISTPINPDGSLDEDIWKTTARVQLDYTNNGGPAKVKTISLFAYDDQNLYVAFESQEPQISNIKAVVTKRDGPTFYDDSVEVFVDPTNKRRDYYHLSANTLGTMFDQKTLNPSWNGNWQTMSKLGSESFTTEIVIPFTTLGATTPAIGTEWALNLTRNKTTSGTVEYLTWAIPYGSFHSPDRFGKIIFK